MGEAREITLRPKPEQDEKGRFVTGNIGGARPVGARNKLGEKFVEDIFNDWKVNGVETIEKVRREKPDAYMKVIASLLPKEVNIKQLDDISDDELIARIRQLEHIVRPFLAKEIEGEVVKHEA